MTYGRIPITDIHPVVEGGQFPATALPGEDITVAATIFREGHDKLGAHAVLTDPSGKEFSRTAMREQGKGLDRYRTTVRPNAEGNWEFHIEAYSDLFATWLHNASVKIKAGIDEDLMIQEGINLFTAAAATAPDQQSAIYQSAAQYLTKNRATPADALDGVLTPSLIEATRQAPIRDLVTSSPSYPIKVERNAAGRGAWYEFFPRSEGAVQAEDGTWTSGTFATAAKRLDGVAKMKFDVVYLPPIHPIGLAHRKGPNNTLVAGDQDPGSPWAIGGAAGGHDSIHPDLGTFEDFDAFVARARELGMEVALDLALQASPDHPWVSEHPEWFTTRADGSIAYAENPPKKYQDIYPINFDNDPEGISKEVLRVVKLWIKHGVKIFRVDNPHTKPLAFWEWLIGRVNKKYPDVVFLAEAFTRPAMMQALGKAGFQQSYSYFTWRNTKQELEEYFQEVSHETSASFRPNFFVNTPDILTEYLQYGGPAAFKVRAALAATASPAWGVYAGYELIENIARPGAEEAIDNEKYQYRPRDWEAAEEEGRSLAPYLTRLNEIRRAHPALMDLQNLTIQHTTDDAVIAYSKHKENIADHGETGGKDTIIVVANVDPHSVREATVYLDLESLGLSDKDLDENGQFTVEELLTGQTWKWGAANYVRLDAHVEPSHILSIKRSA